MSYPFKFNWLLKNFVRIVAAKDYLNKNPAKYESMNNVDENFLLKFSLDFNIFSQETQLSSLK